MKIGWGDKHTSSRKDGTMKTTWTRYATWAGFCQEVAVWINDKAVYPALTIAYEDADLGSVIEATKTWEADIGRVQESYT